MISGKILRDAIISGANNINNQRSRVDELNVFPVPDGDTGTNMGMTVGAAVRELQAMDDSCTVGEAAKTAASAMLRGARGNSGVITSLLFRGFSKALEGKKEADASDIVAALQKGVEGAYKAVMKPTEGTILTVARVASEEAAACGKEDVAELWDVVMTAGQKALEDTPNLLPVLKKAGVVDAGGQGIMIIFEGMGKVFHGEDIVAGGEAVPNKAKLSTENAGKGVFTDDLMKVEDVYKRQPRCCGRSGRSSLRCAVLPRWTRGCAPGCWPRWHRITRVSSSASTIFAAMRRWMKPVCGSGRGTR